MQLELTERQLAFLYPAHIVVDADLRVRGIGPALQRPDGGIETGAFLPALFRWSGAQDAADLADRATACLPLILRRIDGDQVLQGAVIALPDGFLLAMNLMFAGEIDGGGSLADFAPDDNAAVWQMTMRMQHAFLSEYREQALTLAKEQERSASMLEQVFKASGNIGHDLNNHLSVASLNAELIAAHEGPDAAGNVGNTRLARRIIAACTQASIIARSLLSFGQMATEDSVALPVDTVIESRRDFLTAACSGDTSFKVDLGAPGVVIDLIRPGLINAIVNLVINARDATGPGGEICLSTRAVTKENPAAPGTSGEFLEVKVSDKGSGMTPEVLERAFEPFYSTKNRGSGLGLSSVREFAQTMRGEVTATSAPGQGTCITITIPCRHEAAR
ncbi:MAG: hypothetical protein RLZZ08_160 [Pseudomonadota bacterium]|jgi:signal transduction histidine kinase